MDDASKGFDKGFERWFVTMSRTGDKAQQLSTRILVDISDTRTEFFTIEKNG